MPLRLVTEARPIRWKRLSEEEQTHIQDANTWLASVREDAKRHCSGPGTIDRNRSGRVLFIDGPRGSGKTSLMLTMLAGWEHGEHVEDYRPKDGPTHWPTACQVQVMLPILDFDPLPRGMPIHGWLLEPWRREAEKLDGTPSSRGESDLTEQWAEVFERAVIGWAATTDKSTGVVEKAIEYQEKAAGWIDTPDVWHKLVRNAVCRRCKCELHDCKKSHDFVFVVAIDDVDLQVEKLPQLLHAVRLLHHPNVVYVLTGNCEHLGLVLELDYIHRHAGGTRKLENHELRDEVRSHSARLRDAFLEKSIPQHARITLKTWTANEIFKMKIEPLPRGEIVGVAPEVTVGSCLGPEWQKIANFAEDLDIATARRAQHAVDQYVTPRSKEDTTLLDESQFDFIASLCGTTAEKKGNKEWSFALSGRLTTEQAKTIRAWERAGLTITLTDRPLFAFEPDFDRKQIQRGANANRVLFLQLAVEQKNDAKALELTWSPDAGIAATEARWRSGSPRIAGKALFYWPWLVTPTATETLKLGECARKMSGCVIGHSLTDISDSMVLIWLSQSIEWRRSQLDKARRRPGPPTLGNRPVTSMKELAIQLEELANELDDGGFRKEVKRWVIELMIMTAPYFGLSEEIGCEMRRVLWIDGLKSDNKSLLSEERLAIKNAIIRAQGNNSEPTVASSEFDKAVDEFVEQQRAESAESDWWVSWSTRDTQAEDRKPDGSQA